MNVSTNQTGNTADRGTRATRDIKPAKVRQRTGGSFERWFCAVLIALIFATIVIVSAVLTHLTGPFVERRDGPLVINSANGAAQENPGTLQRAAVTAWHHACDASEHTGQMICRVTTTSSQGS
jgi:hypothetical protein